MVHMRAVGNRANVRIGLVQAKVAKPGILANGAPRVRRFQCAQRFDSKESEKNRGRQSPLPICRGDLAGNYAAADQTQRP